MPRCHSNHWRHWNEPGERELSQDGSDVEEERASRKRHLEALREDPAPKRGVGSEDAFSTAKANAKDRAAQLRALHLH